MSQGRLYFGGSFNPIHNGHLQCAAAVAEKRYFATVTLVPSATPPHKVRQNDIAPASDRLTMCRIAQSASPLFEVDELEVRRTGPSYTIDTVTELRNQRGGVVVWLIGADMLQFLPHWHRADELIELADFLVMRRPGFEIDWRQLPAAYRRLEANVVEAPLIPISATDIRRRLAAGLPVANLLPAGVEQYIRSRGLYGSRPQTG